MYMACRDPRTPWHARLVAALVVGYAFSPIDPIPDFIPVLGLLDELVVLPLGIALALRLLPPSVLAEARERAAREESRPVSRAGAAVVIGVWLGLAALGVLVAARLWC
jgi:uncharacterized membrane protein YkvA (DUF1232 family)